MSVYTHNDCGLLAETEATVVFGAEQTTRYIDTTNVVHFTIDLPHQLMPCVPDITDRTCQLCHSIADVSLVVVVAAVC